MMRIIFSCSSQLYIFIFDRLSTEFSTKNISYKFLIALNFNFVNETSNLSEDINSCKRLKSTLLSRAFRALLGVI